MLEEESQNTLESVAFDDINHMRPIIYSGYPWKLRPDRVDWDSISDREKELWEPDLEIFKSAVWVDLPGLYYDPFTCELNLDETDYEYLDYWLDQMIQRYALIIVEQ